MNDLDKTVAWLEEAVPLTPAQACVQVGCLIEEVGELLEAIGCQDDAVINNLKELADTYKTAPQKQNSAYLTHLSALQRNRNDEFTPQVINVADALADIVVTATSSARQLGINMPAALAEVNRSNYSKFENGKPLFDENGKVRKGSHYSPPDLAMALCMTLEQQKSRMKLVERNLFNAFIASISDRIGWSEAMLEILSREKYLGEYAEVMNGNECYAKPLGVANVHVVCTKNANISKPFSEGFGVRVVGLHISSIQVDEERKEVRIFTKNIMADIVFELAGYGIEFNEEEVFGVLSERISKVIHEIKNEIIAWRNENAQKGKELV